MTKKKSYALHKTSYLVTRAQSPNTRRYTGPRVYFARRPSRSYDLASSFSLPLYYYTILLLPLSYIHNTLVPVYILIYNVSPREFLVVRVRCTRIYIYIILCICSWWDDRVASFMFIYICAKEERQGSMIARKDIVFDVLRGVIRYIFCDSQGCEDTQV